ncbi:RNA polymerase sigma factor [Larkinella humicola]|uniref:RNA polymerase sigma factor n=1 Tax=Larkinella humicola TaxID=2607654 RepID=UPI001CD9C156|nr:sigma-70 family RNA polymerase sigma factor [Larkinella humicola]
MTTERQPDSLLWNALKQGDRRAFAELYERYYRILYNYGYKLLPDAALVEDAIQDLFVDLWRIQQNLAEAESVKFYLFRSLRRKIHRLSEKENRFLSIDQAAFPLQTDTTPEHQFTDGEQEQQLTRQLTQALKQLPERQLEVVTLRFYENFKTSEIAAIMGITDKSVRNTLHKAMSHLRENTRYLAPFLGLLFLLLA